MNDDRHADRVIRHWLDDSLPPSADRVVDGVLAAVPSIGQQKAFPTIHLTPIRLVGMAAAVAVAVLLLSAIARGPTVGPVSTQSPNPTASSSSASTASPTPKAPSGIKAAIDMGIDTWSLAVDDRSVWVQVGDNMIGRIDRTTNRDTGIRVNEVPGLVFADGNLWALDIGSGIVRLNPITGAVLQTVPGISGYFIDVEGTTAWVTDVGHSVDRVDLVSGKVVATIDVPAGPKEIAVLDGSAWVTCDSGQTVARIDVATNKVTARIHTLGGPANLAVEHDAAWVWTHEQQLVRIDPKTNTIIATIDGVAPGPGAGLAVGGGYTWVAVSEGIARVDPATNRIEDVIPLPQPGSWMDIAYLEGELWVSSVDGNAIFEIDPTP